MPIIGTYPCCEELLWINFDEEGGSDLGQMFSDECPGCGTKCWHRISNFDPESWTDKEFQEKFIVDEETKAITEKNPIPPELKAIRSAFCEMHKEGLAKAISDAFWESPAVGHKDKSFGAGYWIEKGAPFLGRRVGI